MPESSIDQPWLTIVTVVKDDPDGFAATRDSIVGCDTSGVEWVVVDSSHDHAAIPKILRDSALAANYLWTEPHGVYPAMNEALGLATGEYVYFLNAGDVLRDFNTLSIVQSALSTRPHWLVGEVDFAHEGRDPVTPPPIDYQQAKQRYFIGRFPPHQGTIVLTDDIKDLRGFDERYKIAADYAVMLALATRWEPLVIPESIAQFHVGGLSQTAWRLALREFHSARLDTLGLTGKSLARERILTVQERVVQEVGRALRRVRRIARSKHDVGAVTGTLGS